MPAGQESPDLSPKNTACDFVRYVDIEVHDVLADAILMVEANSGSVVIVNLHIDEPRPPLRGNIAKPMNKSRCDSLPPMTILYCQVVNVVLTALAFEFVQWDRIKAGCETARL
jgi:hypothetical protein